jgi:hypothetical protein
MARKAPRKALYGSTRSAASAYLAMEELTRGGSRVKVTKKNGMYQIWNY